MLIYASDNGFLFGEHGRVELRWPFEEVLRIPLLLRAPGRVSRPGRRVEQMALNIDLAPTLLELAGVPAPAAVQGASLVPLLRDPGAPGRSAFLVEYYKGFPYRAPSYQGVRTEQHLYVEYAGRFPPTLHDVARDPQQHEELMGTPAGERLAPGLREKLDALRRGARFDA